MSRSDHQRATSALESWLAEPDDPRSFPYDDVVASFHRAGKQFVSEHLLDALDKARTALPGTEDDAEADHLAAFLDTALDKRDGHYDYRSYLALPLLPLLSPGDRAGLRRRTDRLIVHLVADIVAFELAVLDGRSTLLPTRRPGAQTVTKRVRHALSVIAPLRRRLGLGSAGPAAPPRVAGRRMLPVVDADQTAAERRALRLSILPVDTEHDEYLFIRVLQAFETTFALLAALLSSTVDDVAAGDGRAGVATVVEAEQALRESAPLFSLLATMQVESFRAFRAHTEGASAIQSRNYKLVESLCRLPDRDRLDSAAYLSVPDVRDEVLAGQPNLEDTIATATGSGRLSETTRTELTAAMRSFAGTLTRWRQTHYKLAVRMLGDRKGTGYTLGTPYLAEVRTIPVFRETT